MIEKGSAEKRFVVDSMLGKVAKWLRILGFDARFERLVHREQLDSWIGQGFLVLTRNRRWCGQARVLCLAANDPAEQLHEVVAGVPIAFEEIRPLHRCIVCNSPLERIAQQQAFGYVPDYVFETNTLFCRCPNCQKIYWPGSHSRRMMERLQQLMEQPV